MTNFRRRLFGLSLKNMSDYYNIIDSAEKIALEKGRELGLAEGLEQGRAEGLLLAARNMLSQGLPVDIVMNVTGLSEDVIAKLS